MKIRTSMWRLYGWIACCVCAPFGFLYLIRPNWWNKPEKITFWEVAFLVGLSGLLKIFGVIQVTDPKTGQSKNEK